MSQSVVNPSGASEATGWRGWMRWRRWPHRIATVTIVVVCWGLGLLNAGWMLDHKYPDMDAMTGRQDAFVFVDVVLGLVACVVLPLVRSQHRRRAGLAACLVVGCTILSTWAVPASLYAIVRVGSWRDARWIGALFGVFMASSVGYVFLVPNEPVDVATLLLVPVAFALLTLWGMYRGSRAALLDSYRERAEVLQREQSARIAQVRAEERAAIAREMHDTLSHRLAIISLHAGALASRRDLPPEQVAETASLVQQMAHQGSEELRSLLSVLREPADRSNMVRVTEAERLVAEARAVGLDVSLDCAPELMQRLESLPPQQSVALAQALHEGLANATKHAPHEHVDAHLAEDGDGVRLSVVNPLSTERSGLAGGFGLVGLDERVRVAGGWLTHGAHDGCHELVAWVPW